MKNISLLLVLAIAGCSSVNIDVPITPNPEIIEHEEEVSSEPSPLEQPWPSKISRDRLIEAALYETFLYFDDHAADCTPEYTIFMEDHFHVDHVSLMQETTEEVLTMFCNDLIKPVYIIGGKNEFVQQTVIENNLPSDEFGGACGTPVGEIGSANWMVACAWAGELAWIGSTIGTVRFGEPQLDEWKFATAIHEVMHLVQDQTFDTGGQGIPPRPNDNFLPVWMIEGGAEYLSDSSLAYLGVQEYQWMTPTDRSGAFIPLEISSDLEVFETWASPSLGPVDYYAGQVAAEYIIASVGFEKYLNILRNMSKNGGNFDYSFEEAIGISLPEFYDRFEEMHLNLYDGKVIGGS